MLNAFLHGLSTRTDGGTMPHDSAIATGNVTPIAVARVRRERLAALAARLTTEGIRPVELDDGDMLVEQGKVAPATSYLVAEGVLNAYVRLDLRRNLRTQIGEQRRTHLMLLSVVPAGYIAFTQGLFRDMGNGGVVSASTIIAVGRTRAYPIGMELFKSTRFPVSMVRTEFTEREALLDALTEVCSEDDLAALLTERSFEIWHLRQMVERERERADAAERRAEAAERQVRERSAASEQLERLLQPDPAQPDAPPYGLYDAADVPFEEVTARTSIPPAGERASAETYDDAEIEVLVESDPPPIDPAVQELTDAVDDDDTGHGDRHTIGYEALAPFIGRSMMSGAHRSPPKIPTIPGLPDQAGRRGHTAAPRVIVSTKTRPRKP